MPLKQGEHPESYTMQFPAMMRDEEMSAYKLKMRKEYEAEGYMLNNGRSQAAHLAQAKLVYSLCTGPLFPLFALLFGFLPHPTSLLSEREGARERARESARERESEKRKRETEKERQTERERERERESPYHQDAGFTLFCTPYSARLLELCGVEACVSGCVWRRVCLVVCGQTEYCQVEPLE